MRSRGWILAALAAVSLGFPAPGRTEDLKTSDLGPTKGLGLREPPNRAAGQGEGDKFVCVIYPLHAMGFRPGQGEWIADILPQVVVPEKWEKRDGKQPVVRHRSAERILVVYQSVGVQREIAGFLEVLKKSLPPDLPPGPRKEDAQVRQTGHVVPAGPAGEVEVPVPAPVPAPKVPAVKAPGVKAAPPRPKHLFHFIIRYEGDGIIDENVVKLFGNQARWDPGLSERETPRGDPLLKAHPCRPVVPPPPPAPGRAPVVSYRPATIPSTVPPSSTDPR